MRGCYRYLLDGEPVDVEETFEIDGTTWRSERRAPGVTLIVCALLGDDRTVRCFEVQFLAGVESVRLDAGLDGTAWTWAVTAADGETVHEPVQPGAYVFPLLRCFQGAAVLAIAGAGPGGLDVVVPDITAPDDPERRLRPRTDRRTVAQLADGPYRYVGGSYDDAATCWLRQDGLLERYTWDQPDVGHWDVQLLVEP